MSRASTFLIVMIIIFCVSFVIYSVHTSPFSDQCIQPGTRYVLTANVSNVVPMELYDCQDVMLLKTDVLQDMRTLLMDTTNILNMFTVEHWGIDETMLGAVLHKGFVPWCTSIRLAIKHADMNRLIRCRKEFERRGFLLVPFQGGYIVHYNNFNRFPMLHIITMEVQGDTMCICVPLPELGECAFQDAYISSTDISNRRYIPIENSIFRRHCLDHT